MSSNADRIALRSIPGLLLRTGYVDAHATLGILNLRRRDLIARLDRLAPTTRAMIELWFLERAVPRAALTAFAPELDALVAANVLRRTGEDLVSAGCIAMPMFGQIVLLPSPADPGSVPYGIESFALALRIGPPRPGRCLDLCSGSGIQSLRAAASGCEVVAIEIDATGCAWAKRNALVNGLEDRIDVREGDLWAVAGDQSFDYIVANPPCAFVPPGVRSPSHAGGPDGLAVMRRVTEQLPRMLAPGGIGHFLGGCLGTEDTIQIVDELRAQRTNEHLRIVVSVTSRSHLVAGQPLYDHLVTLFASGSALPRAEVERALDAHLRALGKTHFYRYVFVASRETTATEIELTRYDLAGGVWYVL